MEARRVCWAFRVCLAALAGLMGLVRVSLLLELLVKLDLSLESLVRSIDLISSIGSFIESFTKASTA